jgi:hypothetical protein
MSVVGIHVHFHNGELAKLAGSLVDGYIAVTQSISSKITFKGAFEKYERRYHQAVKDMALMKKFLTPEQQEAIHTSLVMCVIRFVTFILRLSYQNSVCERQSELTSNHASYSKKERLALYKKAVTNFTEVIRVSSMGTDVEHSHH